MKNVLFISLAVILILVSGCGNEEADFSDRLSKATALEEFRVVYNVSSPFFEEVMVSGFKKNDIRRIYVNYEGEEYDAFYVSGTILNCQGFENCWVDELHDDFERYYFTPTIFRVPERADYITYEGEGEVIGRTCDEFSVGYDNSIDLAKVVSLLGIEQQIYVNEGWHVLHACLDRETGVMLSLMITNDFFDSNIGENVSDELLRYNAIFFSLNVDDKSIEIPDEYVVSEVGCSLENNEGTLRLLPLKEGIFDISIWPELGFWPNPLALTQENQFSQFKAINIPFEIPIAALLRTQNNVCVESNCKRFACTMDDGRFCLRHGSDEDACVGAGCTFQEGYCEPFSCFDTKDKVVCDAHNECYWTEKYGQGCVERECFRYETEELCLSDENCLYEEYCMKNPEPANVELTVYTK